MGEGVSDINLAAHGLDDARESGSQVIEHDAVSTKLVDPPIRA
jgi:hypothetical protein